MNRYRTNVAIYTLSFLVIFNTTSTFAKSKSAFYHGVWENKLAGCRKVKNNIGEDPSHAVRSLRYLLKIDTSRFVIKTISFNDSSCKKVHSMTEQIYSYREDKTAHEIFIGDAYLVIKNIENKLTLIINEKKEGITMNDESPREIKTKIDKTNSGIEVTIGNDIPIQYTRHLQ